MAMLNNQCVYVYNILYLPVYTSYIQLFSTRGENCENYGFP